MPDITEELTVLYVNICKFQRLHLLGQSIDLLEPAAEW